MGTSKLIMGLTLVLVVSLALVLGLVLVLLAELYCSLLIRRRQRRVDSPDVAAAAAAPTTVSNSSPRTQSAVPSSSLSSFYAQGVLDAPRSFLFPAASDNDIEKQQHLQPPENQEPSIAKHQASGAPREIVGKVQLLKGCSSDSGHGDVEEHLFYSNPIYDIENGRPSRGDNTPFETPDTSPSRLETADSSGDDEKEDDISSSPNCSSSKPLITPPLTPMKKLPAEACSVSLKDARSLGTSGSDSNSNNGVSSSSSGTPCTSPSW